MFSKKSISISISAALILGTVVATQAQAAPHKAFNFGILKTQTVGTGAAAKHYVLFGRVGAESPLTGNTQNDQRRSLLCVSKERNAGSAPAFINGGVSAGGANVNTWSERTFLVIPNVQSDTLLSRSDADQKCDTVAKIVYGASSVFRMAEFHDGTGPNPGWGFWAEGYNTLQGLSSQPLIGKSSEARYWIDVEKGGVHPW
jgi:hypothetical protein